MKLLSIDGEGNKRQLSQVITVTYNGYVYDYLLASGRDRGSAGDSNYRLAKKEREMNSNLSNANMYISTLVQLNYPTKWLSVYHRVAIT